jgi:hypothetical protein
VGRPERVIGLAKGIGAVGSTSVRIQPELFDKGLKRSGHVQRDVIRSFRPPSGAGIEGGDALEVTGPGCRA